MYQVIGKDGQVYGPVSLPMLQEWAADRRLEPQMMMIDPISGETKRAEQMLAGYDVFPQMAPPINAPAPMEQQIVMVSSSAPLYAPASGEPQFVVVAAAQHAPLATPVTRREPASLVLRFIGCFVDALCGIPLVALSFVPFLGLIGAPLLCLYWLSRDNFFGGQSIGKRVTGTRVIREDGRPFTWGDSATRNIICLSFLIMMIPFVGDFLAPLCIGFPGLLEIVLVLATRKRLGDHLGHTFVVAA